MNHFSMAQKPRHRPDPFDPSATTSKGTRTYAVTHISQISSTDWSYLSATTDNRLTLITCVENQPALRWCIQAVEVT